MISKTKAAKEQLDTAIRLFFENLDHISAYTLASASREITDKLCEKKKNEIFQKESIRLGDALKVRLNFWDELKIHIKDEHFKDAVKLVNKTKNFLKHADDDHDTEIEDITVQELSYLIFFAIKNFVLLEQSWTPAMSTFTSWFGAAYPHLLLKGEEDDFLRLVSKMQRTFSNMFNAATFYEIYSELMEQPAYRIKTSNKISG